MVEMWLRSMARAKGKYPELRVWRSLSSGSYNITAGTSNSLGIWFKLPDMAAWATTVKPSSSSTNKFSFKTDAGIWSRCLWADAKCSGVDATPCRCLGARFSPIKTSDGRVFNLPSLAAWYRSCVNFDSRINQTLPIQRMSCLHYTTQWYEDWNQWKV